MASLKIFLLLSAVVLMFGGYCEAGDDVSFSIIIIVTIILLLARTKTYVFMCHM